MWKAEGQFFTGGLPEEPKANSRLWEAPSFGVGKPINFDIEQAIGGKLPIKDQGQSYSCTGQAVSYYTQVLQIVEMMKLTDLGFHDLKENQPQAVFEHSAKALYSQNYLPDGGAFLSSVIKTACTWGSISEEKVISTPDETAMRDVSWKDTNASWQAAKLQNKGFAWISPVSYETVCQAIRLNYGVVVVVAGSNNGTWRSPSPKPPKSAEWYHALYLGKVTDDGVQTPNSWGFDFWQTLGWDYFESGNVISAFTIVDQPSNNYVTLYRPSLEHPGVNLKRELRADQPAQIAGFLHDGWTFTKLPNAVV